MSTAAFIAAIHQAPEDDAPRLIYADWLDEHGEPERAKLIRWMVAVPSYSFVWTRGAEHGRHFHAERTPAIRGLKGLVEDRYRGEWDKLPAAVDRMTVRGGFIEAVRVHFEPFVTAAGDLFRWHPITFVTIAGFRVWTSFERPGKFEAVLPHDGHAFGYRPATRLIDHAADEDIYFDDKHTAIRALSRLATAYGRRMAGILKEPPPLPTRG